MRDSKSSGSTEEIILTLHKLYQPEDVRQRQTSSHLVLAQGRWADQDILGGSDRLRGSAGLCRFVSYS